MGTSTRRFDETAFLKHLTDLETNRQKQEFALLQSRNPQSKKEWGQIPTPFPISVVMAKTSLAYLSEQSYSDPYAVLEPSMGSGSLISGLLHATLKISDNTQYPGNLDSDINRFRSDHPETETNKIGNSGLETIDPTHLQIYGYEIDPDFYSLAHFVWIPSSINNYSKTDLDLGKANTPAKASHRKDHVILDSKSSISDRITISNQNFFEVPPKPTISLVLANPPYTRHQDIPKEQKKILQDLCYERTGIYPAGTSSMVVYFILNCHPWLKEGAVSCWLIPQEFLQADYGAALRTYLTSKVRMLRLHLFDVQESLFQDVKVSSCLLWFKNNDEDLTDKDQKENQRENISGLCGCKFLTITYGDNPDHPDSVLEIPLNSLDPVQKWNFYPDLISNLPRQNQKSGNAEFSTHQLSAADENPAHSKIHASPIQNLFPGQQTPDDQIPNNNIEEDFTLGDFFTIHRGLATGSNSFFIVDQKQIEKWNLEASCLVPVLPSPKQLQENIIHAKEDGDPMLDHPLYLIQANLPGNELQMMHPNLWSYLQTGLDTIANHTLCKKRKIWYSMEKREPALFLIPCFHRIEMDQKSSETGVLKGVPIKKTGNQATNSLRIVMNESRALATNSWMLLYPKPALQRKLDDNTDYQILVFKALQNITSQSAWKQGRKYGGGLTKLEPSDLPKLKCMDLLHLESQES